jgi:phenylalanyl-tRNA synthetase beta chain
MKISCNWLKEYINTTLTPAEIGSRLTACGLEVEGIEEFDTVKGGLKGLVIGEVLTCTKHPNADKLSLTTVNTGGGVPLQIVCGASNVAAGQKVIVATVGTTVHPVSGDPFEIKKSKIRGELSEGMICAEDEIGLGTSHDGILVLPPDAIIGQSASEYFKVETDFVFEIGLTPNRADAASHIGVARDLSAVVRTSMLVDQEKKSDQPAVKFPSVENFSEGNKKSIQVIVEDTAGCPRYSGITVSNIKVTDSPSWLKSRLESIGVKPINNIVDITNYVLHECGQPLHAFDAAKIKGGKVVVRRAKANEKFVSLDGVGRKLSEQNLMICNETDPMCIAGVFGGMDSGITENTTEVFLESAHFSPASIRKTSKEHGLKTDASFRFERGTDPELTIFALKRAALLFCEIAGGKITSPVTDVYFEKIQPVEVKISYDKIENSLGKKLDKEVINFILSSLGVNVKAQGEQLMLTIPTYKIDVNRPADVVEEILRIYGYDRIPLPEKMTISAPAITGFDREIIQEKTADYLAANGFNEILSNSLSSEAYYQGESNVVKITNPLSQELSVMRKTMLYSGLEALQYNRNRRQSDMKIFEFGKTYSKEGEKYDEAYHLSLFITGRLQEISWKGKNDEADIFHLKSWAKNILSLCNLNEKKYKLQISPTEFFSTSASFIAGKDVLCEFGMVKKSILKNFDLNQPVYYADFNWDLLMKHADKTTMQYSEISKFPGAKRDLSMIIASAVSYEQIESIAYKTERKILRDIKLFDIYQGDKIEAGKKSLAISFILQDDEQTLTDKQIDKTMERLMEAFRKEVDAVIRTA